MLLNLTNMQKMSVIPPAMELTSSTNTWPLPSALLLGQTLTIALALYLILLLRGHYGGSSTKKKKKGLPPGPSTLVFVARLVALRRSIFDIGPLLRDLHARHGPVISFRMIRTVVFVADSKVAHRVLVQSGATFNDRPPLPEPVQLFTCGTRNISTSPYGAYWRLVRRNLSSVTLHPARVALFAPARRGTRDTLARYLVRSSGGKRAVEVRPVFRRAMLDLFMHMCLGATLGPLALDEVGELQLRILRAITSFPVFSFFPAITKRLFRRRWAGFMETRRRQDEMFLPLIHARRELQRKDDDLPCYADDLLALGLAEDGGRRLTDAEIVTLCSEFFIGGVDATTSLLEWIMAELVNRPDIQSKVYEEVKSGDDRPYLKAVVLEGLRLHPPSHLLISHGVLSHGAEIGGYAVPKGTEVNFMVADFGRDEAVWRAARKFRPERFLDGGEGHGVDMTGSKEIKMMPFGAGRRMCPGHTLGILHLEYFVESLVREFEWLPALEGQKVDMTEELDFTVVMKHPLHARVVPRT